MPAEWTDVHKEHLDALCPELHVVVGDAAAAGNPVVETWTEFGRAVRLTTSRPVLVDVPPETRARLRYVPVNDAHYWLGEIHCHLHPGWFVAIPFSNPSDRDLPDLGLEPLVPKS